MLAVAGALVGDVDPVGAGLVVLPDELVEMEVGGHPLEPALASGKVGDADIAGLAGNVLGGGGAADKGVELTAAVAGGDKDPLRFPLLRGKVIKEVLAEGFEDFLAEDLEVGDDAQGCCIADVVGGGCGAALKFVEVEMW